MTLSIFLWLFRSNPRREDQISEAGTQDSNPENKKTQQEADIEVDQEQGDNIEEGSDQLQESDSPLDAPLQSPFASENSSSSTSKSSFSSELSSEKGSVSSSSKNE